MREIELRATYRAALCTSRTRYDDDEDDEGDEDARRVCRRANAACDAHEMHRIREVSRAYRPHPVSNAKWSKWFFYLNLFKVLKMFVSLEFFKDFMENPWLNL